MKKAIFVGFIGILTILSGCYRKDPLERLTEKRDVDILDIQEQSIVAEMVTIVKVDKIIETKESDQYSGLPVSTFRVDKVEDVIGVSDESFEVSMNGGYNDEGKFINFIVSSGVFFGNLIGEVEYDLLLEDTYYILATSKDENGNVSFESFKSGKELPEYNPELLASEQVGETKDIIDIYINSYNIAFGKKVLNVQQQAKEADHIIIGKVIAINDTRKVNSIDKMVSTSFKIDPFDGILFNESAMYQTYDFRLIGGYNDDDIFVGLDEGSPVTDGSLKNNILSVEKYYIFAFKEIGEGNYELVSHKSYKLLPDYISGSSYTKQSDEIIQIVNEYKDAIDT